MEQQKKTSGLWGVIAAVWRGIDMSCRIILNVFILTMVFILLALVGDDTPEVPKSTALVLTPRGQIVEQLAGDGTERAMQKLTDQEEPETLRRDLVDAIRNAKDDDRVKVLVLNLNQVSGAGWGPSKLQNLRAVIDDFKTSSKPVIATSDFYDKTQYYLASAADEIYLHHLGVVVLDGYGRFRTYYKEGIDRLEIDWNVFRVGEFKSAVEPYLRDDMSDEAKTANLDWMGDLWSAYLADVAAARNLTPEAVSDAVDRFNELLEGTENSASQVALQVGLVDHVGTRDEVRDRIIELVGENEDTGSYHRIGHDAYLEALGDKRRRYGDKGDAVAVIIAKGSILDGSHPPGTIGGDSTAALIREARRDDDVKAIVLRVDSGGGSAFASEVIRRQLVLAREEGKKVVVSMASVAASGGYWISTASDEIWASPNTITGSIGIYGMMPTFQKPLAKHLGVRVDGVGTNWMAGAVRPDRELDKNAAEIIERMIGRGYEEFLTRVSEARGMTREEVDTIGRGRVWSGLDAHERGLVDKLGGLDDAIASAAALAGLGEDFAVHTLEKELDFTDRLMIDLLTRANAWFGPDPGMRAVVRNPPLHEAFFDFVGRQAKMLAELNDPNGIYALCLCEIE